jgi:hypothetical protein
VGGAGPVVNAYFHYFPFLLDVAPPPSSSSSPASRAASLHRHAPLRPVATEVRTPISPHLWTPRPSSRGRTPVAPRRRAAAGDADHRARLGCDFLQVSPPSPTCARRLSSLAPLAVGSRPVLVAIAPCRRVHVAFAFARVSVRAATPSRRRAPQHARTVTLEARLGLWPLSCAGPPARPPRRLRRLPHAYEPSCGRQVRRHPWRRPKRRRAVCVHPVPGQARVDHPSAHAHPSARLHMDVARPSDRREVPAPAPPPRPRQHHRRAIAAAPAPVPTTPRTPSPFGV